MSAWIPAPPPESDPAIIKTRGVIRSAPELALGRGGIFGEHLVDPRRPIHQFAAAIGAAVVELLGAFGAEGAFERADEGAGFVGGQVDAAAFAVGAHLEHEALVALPLSHW